MREKIQNIFVALISLGLIALVSWGLFKVVIYFIELFSELSNAVAASIIAAIGTVLISVISVITTKYFDKKREIRKEHREKKIPVYEELISFMLKVILSKNIGKKPPNEHEITIFLMKFTEKIIIWGSDDVLKSYQFFREELIKTQQSSDKTSLTNVIFNFENLILEIRKDLGHKNKDIDKGDILSLFVNDIKAYA